MPEPRPITFEVPPDKPSKRKLDIRRRLLELLQPIRNRGIANVNEAALLSQLAASEQSRKRK